MLLSGLYMDQLDRSSLTNLSITTWQTKHKSYKTVRARDKEVKESCQHASVSN